MIVLDICHFQVIFVGFTKSVAVIISVLLQRWKCDVTKSQICEIMGLVSINIQKDQDEKNSLAKNQPVSENKHQGPVARSMVSVNQRLIPWQRIGFDTA